MYLQGLRNKKARQALGLTNYRRVPALCDLWDHIDCLNENQSRKRNVQ